MRYSVRTFLLIIGFCVADLVALNGEFKVWGLFKLVKNFFWTVPNGHIHFRNERVCKIDGITNDPEML